MRTRPARRDEPEAFVVSGARASRHADIDRRQRKYLVTMLVRTLAFIASVALFIVGFKWIAAVLLALSLIAPLIGVVIANNHTRSAEGDPELYDAATQVPAIGPGPTIEG